MRIKGVYILSRKSIARMLTVMSAVLLTLCTTATAKDESFIGRIHNTSIALHKLDMKIAGRSTHTVVKPAKYHKCKLVYLEAKQYNKEHPPSKAECCQYPVPTANRQPDGALAIGNIGTGNISTLATLERVPQLALATKADLKAVIGLIAELSKKINEIHDASVLGIPPPDKRLRGLIRQKQVLYGVEQYKPHEVSFEKAARMAILAFKGKCGAYSEREWKSLKQAIRRHVLDERKKFAT